MVQHWRVSPNVMEDPKTVDYWKAAIRATRCAIMGERKNKRKKDGREVWKIQFEKIPEGDIVLIARRDRSESDMFAFGVVKSPLKYDYFRQPKDCAYYRILNPFILWEDIKKEWPPESQWQGIWPRGHALQHLDSEKQHKSLCEWMEEQLEGLDNSNDSRHHGAPHQPDIQRRHEVEEAAYKAVEKYYEEDDYDVDDVQKDKCGYDLKATKNGRILKVEVKGLSGENAVVELTPNEYKCFKKGDNYRLCVVTNALDNKPKRRIQEFKFDSKKRRWFDQDENELVIEERMGARVKCG